MPVVPARGDDPRRALCDLVAERAGARIWTVHRIDAATSGLVVFAKDPAAHKRLSQAFEARTVRKTYLAAVKGEAFDGGTETPLRTFGSGRVGADPEGKPSQTRWAVRERFRGATLLAVAPRTGRRHQIRVHLFLAGTPILGDRRYGKDRPVGGAPRLMLHAWRLALPAADGGELELEAPPPADFEAVLEGLRTS
ncbi:MAG: RNA pseudouridine synthase [Elusimicrobia bacterium]|nr:RNA pseudouridine synthase [Elusimicrobiota bacterium]